MRNLQSIILPGIIIGVVGGILLFFAAYNFYPQKNVNINLNGDCYEFLDEAFAKYQLLEIEREKELLRLQLDAIGNIPALIPITFSGSSDVVDQIVDANQINVTNRQTLGDNNTQIDKVIIRGIANISVLERVYDKWQRNISGASTDIENTEIGILPNQYITSEESIKIRDSIDDFMLKGIKEIINSSQGVRPAECRSTIVYQDS
ncbi:hypothetical protein [Candidatus Nitrosocosmicus franklandus]|uniref:Uncharacterized protein n=1 Tax=Candidatus Nitrosocosmicus franklandianus TaxID=1798806 RepID=A0A484I9K2_9ARCH|nr:hypothetical protein [Candidatus Nitrosocosmicus franklandus]VFJ12672.1 conserved protein of unknown function [Candidatus Nitrosocosmicus franklandus]